MPARPLRLAIVTVLFNSAAVLPDFLASLSVQRGDVDWTLIAVDNASTDRGPVMVDAWAGNATLIVNGGNRGFAAATNQGIRLAQEAGYDAVLLLNNDTVFDAGFLAALADAARSRPDDLLAPVVLYDADPSRAWYAGGRFTWLRGAWQVHADERVPSGDTASWPADFAPGCALLVPMRAFDRVGLLDERFFVYWEDADFCLRCRKAGLAITVLRRPTIRHKVSVLTDGENSPFSVRMYQGNQILFLRKHLGGLATAAQLPLLVAKALSRALRGREPWSVTRLRLATIATAIMRRGEK